MRIFADIARVTAGSPEVEDFEAVRELQAVRDEADPEAVELGSDRELAATANGSN